MIILLSMESIRNIEFKNCFVPKKALSIKENEVSCKFCDKKILRLYPKDYASIDSILENNKAGICIYSENEIVADTRTFWQKMNASLQKAKTDYKGFKRYGYAALFLGMFLVSACTRHRYTCVGKMHHGGMKHHENITPIKE
jgi:hypothetical protein